MPIEYDGVSGYLQAVINSFTCTLRRKTINWCRSAAFSASSRLFDLNGAVKTAGMKHSNAIMLR
jgi:hypothetical protein